MNKITINVNKIKCVEIICDQWLGELWGHLARVCGHLERLANTVDSWFKQQLFFISTNSNMNSCSSAQNSNQIFACFIGKL